MSERYLLEMLDIVKEFPGVKALDGVSLRVRAGSVHALMGENGAGKSTLMKCLFGIYHKSSGSVLLEGKEVAFRNPKDALEHGVAMVHQELNQALCRSVAENLWLGRYPTVAGFVVSSRRMREDTERLFEQVGLSIDPFTTMRNLSVAQRQMVEIAKAISYDARVIVLDEPTSSLTEQEVAHLFRMIRMLRDRGCGIIYISHKMEEILQISDEVTVMRDGTYVGTEPARGLTMDTIIHMMVGRPLTNRFPPKRNMPTETVLEVSGLSCANNPVRDVSFSLRRGEILGFAGLAGAGRTEVVENLFGLSERAGGRILLHGKEIRNRTPSEAKRNGFALLTEERRATGIFGVLDICENATLASLGRYSLGGAWIRERSRREATDWAVSSMHVKTASNRTQIQTLSGGNQQKVIFGRWLLTEPEILMLDEPTRGIDVGAKYEIYQLIVDLAEKGKSIIMVSSELPELLGVCDRICVMSGGRMVGEVDAGRTTQEEILALAAKHA
ncbi:MAG: ATP-binding cassette domain-containing protein [Ruminococcaceae bacterium]|nr:ATP-binding cassette domain-containing protein [Oscillospiraceae bacterium]